MTAKPQKNDDLASLRAQALSKINVVEQNDAQKILNDGDMRKQLQELELHQIELELQNEELAHLKNAAIEMKAGLVRYTDLFHYAPVGYLTFGRDGTLSKVNITGANILGMQRAELIGQKLNNFICASSLPTFHAFMDKIFNGEGIGACELVLINQHKSQLFVHIDANLDASREKCRAVLENITARKLAEMALQRANQGLEATILGRTDALMSANKLLLQEIEQRKLSQESLLASQEQLRLLSAHQEDLKEQQRKHIAREIHDDLGQNLLALRIDVALLSNLTENENPQLKQKISGILAQIDTTIKSVRSIMNDLRPAVLDLGLLPAIEWLVKEFKQRNNIDCEFICDDMPERDCSLNDGMATALFRILQESLTNIAKHAQATRIWIEVSRDDANLYMKIADNGVGMAQGAFSRSDAFGLVGIRERIVS